MKANQRQEGGSQHWDYCWERQFDLYQYCITKYVERWKRKNGVNDLIKAKHYLEKYIELVNEGAEPGPGYTDQG